MLIYTLFIVPIIFTIVMFFKFKHEVVWWEYLIVFGVSIIGIVATKAIIETIQTSDTEYWGGWVKEVRYYEDWNEYIHRTCTRTVSCGKDCTRTETYDCSYVDYHPEYWEVRGSNGESIHISNTQYNQLLKKFGTGKKFVDMHRHYHTNDGDMYSTIWSGSDETLEPLITKHKYENRVRVSSSTYAQAEPDKEIFTEYGLFHYPEIYDYYRQKVILGYDDSKAEKAFQLLNAKLGASKEFKSYIIVFKNKGREAGLYQEQQWQGGNKNELNIAIGIDDQNNIKWCHVFSWTDDPLIMVETRDFVERQGTLNLVELANFLSENVPAKWQRKHFSDFNYLTIEPKTSHIVIAFIIIVIINIGVAVFVIQNEFTENNYDRKRYRY